MVRVVSMGMGMGSTIGFEKRVRRKKGVTYGHLSNVRMSRLTLFRLTPFPRLFSVSKDHYPVYLDHPGNPVKFFE
jgi:hypothetical protein